MKISIITPSYNSQPYIENTIESIKNQSYSNFEHIVIDGLSKDSTVEVIKKYPHIHWISEADNGQSNAINKGFRIASGDILAWQNADDLYLPETFEIVAKTFANNPEVDVIYGNYQIIDVEGNFVCNVKAVDWNPWLFKHGRFVPMQPTTFWRRRVYDLVGDLDENLQYCMDIDFFCRAVSKRAKFLRVDKCLGQFRVHPASKTSNSINRSSVYQERKQVLAKHFNYSWIDSLYFDLFWYRGKIARFIKIDCRRK